MNTILHHKFLLPNGIFSKNNTKFAAYVPLHTEVCAVRFAHSYINACGVFPLCAKQILPTDTNLSTKEDTKRCQCALACAIFICLAFRMYASKYNTQTIRKKKPKPKKKNGYKYIYTKSKITTEKKRITNKNMRGVLQFSVFSVVLSL